MQAHLVAARNSAPKSVFFIASSAVELKTGRQSWRLGPGEVFGQMAILTKKPFRAEVRSIAPSTLLVMDEARFRRLLDRSEAWQRAVHTSAEKRSIDIPSQGKS